MAIADDASGDGVVDSPNGRWLTPGVGAVGAASFMRYWLLFTQHQPMGGLSGSKGRATTLARSRVRCSRPAW